MRLVKGKTAGEAATLCSQERRRLSGKEHREDALALGAEERRDKLRKAVGRSKYPVIHGYLNGGTHMERLHVSAALQGETEGNPAN